MSKISRSWELLTPEFKQQKINDFINFFNEEIDIDTNIGIISAEKILDHFVQHIGIHLYNKGINDSISYFNDRFDDLKFDMETLMMK